MCGSVCISYILNCVFHVCEDYILLAWKQVWSLLLLRNDDSRRHVTYFRGIVNNLVAVVAYNGNVIS